MSKYLLGIDNGSTVTKAAIYDLHGNEIAVSSCKTNLLFPAPGFIERNMDELWEANVSVIRAVISDSGIAPGSIAGIGITGHGNGIYLIDKKGNPVCNGVVSTDVRAAGYVSKWYSDGTFKKVHPKTLQNIYPGQPVPLLAWFKEHDPVILEKTRWILMCKDYLRYCLTGGINVEITDIAATNLINVIDKRYDRELLSDFGLEDIYDKLPPIKYSTDICGHVTKKAAGLTGLKEGTPVAGGFIDIDACAVATGIVDENRMCVVAGTWSINEYISKKPVLSSDIFLSSVYCMDGYWLNMEGSVTSASNLEWFIEQFLGKEKALTEEEGGSIYRICDEMVSQVDPEDSQIIFLPFLFGTSSGENEKACFIGMKGWHTKSHVIRAIYEGVVFSHLYHINRLLKHRARPEAVRISGGASRSKVWVRIFADILQMPVEVVKGTELGTFGAAICAGVAANHFSSFKDAVDSMLKVAYICTPSIEKMEIYGEKYSLYKEAIRLLRPLWNKYK